jgi:Papain fold toxin 1, glutamine deamidase
LLILGNKCNFHQQDFTFFAAPRLRVLMENQINVGIQRQSYEPSEQVDSEAENSGAETSLAGDSAGTNTSGNPDIANAQVDGESVNQAPPETVPTNNLLNRYSIGDTVILGRPEYIIDNRAAPVETAFAPNETPEAMPFALLSESVSNDAMPAQYARAMPTTTPSGFIPAPEIRPDPPSICPDQTDLGSSGLEAAAPTDAKPLEQAPTDATSNAKDATNAPTTQRGTKLPPHDSVAFTAAREYSTQHGFSKEETNQVAAILAYYHCETTQHCSDTLGSLPFHISSIMQSIGGNSDGLYDVGFALRGLQEAQAIANGDPNAGNRNVPDGRADRGVDMMGVQQVGGARGISRAGAGQGGEDYAREMTAASYTADTNYYDLGDDYSNESYDASNSYDTYDPAESSPQIDLDPLPSLPPVDSTGPMMLPEPVINLDHELAHIPTIDIDLGGGGGSGGSYGAGGGSTDTNSTPREISLTTPTAPATVTNSEGQRNFMGLNGNGQPLYSDPASREQAPSEIVPTNNRFHGLANAVEGSVIGYDTNGTPYSGVPDSNAPGGMRWYSLDFADTNAFRASQAAHLLATDSGRGGSAGSTIESLPPVENLYQPIAGHVAASYRTAVDGMMNPNARWDERIINGTLATLASPVAVIDMMGEAFMNAPNAAGRAGQWFAQANVTTNPDTRVTAALSGIVEMTNAFNGAVGPFAGVVGVPQRVMTVEELARQNMQSAESLRAARATYTGLGDNGGLYTSMKPLGDVFPELVGVNPHYVPGAPAGTNTNCASCANAAQARLSGLDVEATALPSGRYAGQNDLLPSAPLGFQPPTTVAAIEQQMLAAGDGAYGVVLIGPENTTQHVINVVNRNGVVYFVDTQLGRIVTLPPNVEVRLGLPL